MMLSNNLLKIITPSIFALPHSKLTKTLIALSRIIALSLSTRSPSCLEHGFFLLSGIYLHQDRHVTGATSRALAPRRYHNLSSTIMVFVCLYGFHKCISCSVCHWQCRSALRSAIAGTCYSRAGIARTIALYRDSWVVASVGQFNRYYCEHALSTHMW